MEKNYLYISNSRDAYGNIALDEWFLDHVREDELILYFFINERAVIIGKNQNPWIECDLERMSRDGVQLARRVSGGGAVYHDGGNLNYSFIAGRNRYDKERQQRLIIEAVESVGIPCGFSGRNDLLAGGRKFSGSAYCSRATGELHHGTLLISSDLAKLSEYLTVDPRKIRSKGVESVRSRVCNLNEFVPDLTVERMLEVIPGAFEKVYGPYEIYPFGKKAEKELARRRAVHASKEWRFGAAPEFDYQIDARLSFGGVRVLLTLKGGRIARSVTYTDANDAALPETVDALLCGLPFEKEALVRALSVAEKSELAELAAHIETLSL